MNTFDIYSARFTFFSQTKKKVDKKFVFIEKRHVVENVVCKYMPIKFLINEKTAYKRALRDFSDSFVKELENDKQTGLKRFTVKYLHKIGETN